MNKSALLAVLLSVMCLSVSAKSICSQRLGQNPNLVDVQVNSGKLDQVENSFVRVYGLNSADAPSLPVTESELSGITYVEYNSSVVQSSRSPVWGDDFPFPRATFNEATYIAIELWNQQSSAPEVDTFIAGAQFSIADLQTYDKEFTLKLTDAQGNSPAQLDVTWTNGRC